jgi:hypothetical protein
MIKEEIEKLVCANCGSSKIEYCISSFIWYDANTDEETWGSSNEDSNFCNGCGENEVEFITLTEYEENNRD